MQRFVALIAIIFAFASLAGTATAHAHRYVSTPIVVLNHVDANNMAIPVVVKVQRGEIELGSGIVMPCGPHHAIGVTGPSLPPAQQCAAPERGLVAAMTDRPSIRMLRPPISA